MGALTLGPIVLSLDRAYAGLGFMVLLVGAELLARRGRPDLAAWGWYAALAAFVGARLGFVAANLEHFVASPAQVVAIWQGGFAPWWGVAAAAGVSVAYALRDPALRGAMVGVGIVAVAAWWFPSAVVTSAGVGSDTRMPELTLEGLVGSAVDLGELGAPAIVNVWATWCPPCRRELPVLFAAAVEQSEVEILLVNQREGRELVRRYLDQAGFPTDGVLLDPTGRFGDALRVAGLPTTFAFDATGRLVDVHVGEISAPALSAMMQRTR